ncbi:PREDICTED: lipolysis-stimulated lipoprotein receptor isoform X5 [Chinchilla lanigera]|uniref:lipolysis-stimulated lipoprotein receptor isoform X5 n=1 Tax=Chinchilla lanigera TaxID=34839 RepID=UPI00038EE0CC|nr:PREDICTED: lipolysis-stimulated lipoprotein receptor isoform X5 [Chinchilla lanigera]
MAPAAFSRSCGPGAHTAAVVFLWLLLSTWCTAPAGAIQVTVSNPYHVVILFQPVTLPCSYQMTSTLTAPIVIWKYKSFCRNRIADAFSPASVDNQINAQLAASNPGYNPYVECQDSVRTVRVVATKQGNAVTLGDYYQGRRITITGMYAAGKAATSGVPSIYAPSTYAHLSPAKTPPPPPAMIPMGPVYNGYPGGYPGDFDRNSSVGGHSSQVPLLRDTDSNSTSEVRSGYRIQANQQDDSMRVLYYMEKELANFDPSRPGPPNGRVERAMSEVTSLHEDDWRSRPSRCPALSPIRDEEWGHRSPRSPRRWEQEPPTERAGSGRPRARSVDALDDLTRPGSAESGRRSPANSGRRGRACAPPRSRSRDDLYNPDDDSRDFPHSRDPHYDDFRSRDRPPADPRSRYRSRDPRDDGSRSRDPQYDGRLLDEALRRKGLGERRRPHREEEEEEAYYPPAPPPYSETESQASRERKLKKNLALSRESLVV